METLPTDVSVGLPAPHRFECKPAHERVTKDVRARWRIVDGWDAKFALPSELHAAAYF